MTKLQELKKHLRPGKVYRREDLARWSNAVDRHLRQLVEEGTLTKLAGGLYAYPRQTVFGKAPAQDDELVATFLKDDRFLLASPNAYNSLGVGTTQLYDKTVVYNHKRHGEYALGGRKFDFRVKPAFPEEAQPGVSAGRSREQPRQARREQDGGSGAHSEAGRVGGSAAPAARRPPLWQCSNEEVLRAGVERATDAACRLTTCTTIRSSPT